MTACSGTPLSSSRAVRRGVLAAAALLGGPLVWSVTTDLSDAIVASGIVRVQGARHSIEHAHGGQIVELLIEEGQRVSAGQVLARLDDPATRASLARARLRRVELEVLIARLSAGLEGREKIDTAVVAYAPEHRQMQLAQQSLLTAQRLQETDAKDTHRARLLRLQEAISGNGAILESLANQRATLATELEDLTQLKELGLARAARLAALQREKARLEGETARVSAASAQSLADLQAVTAAEAERRSSQRHEWLREQTGAKAELRMLKGDIRALEERMESMTLRAPVEGMVFNITRGPGSVLPSGEPLLEVVPSDAARYVEARLRTSERMRIETGDSARILLPGSDPAQTTERDGYVDRIAADSARATDRDAIAYEVWIAFAGTDGALSQSPSDDSVIYPGLEVDVLLSPAPQSALSYLLHPLKHRLRRAFGGVE